MINYKSIIITFFTLFLTLASYAQATKNVDDLIKELEGKLETAISAENYEEAGKLKSQIKAIEANRVKIESLQKEKQEAITKEDYDKVIAIDKEIALLKKNVPTKEKPIKVVPEASQESTPEIVPPTVLPPSNNSGGYGGDFNFFKNSFYIDGMAGIMNASGYSSNLGIGVRIGNKWYFGQNETFRSGFQVRWVKVGMFPLDNIVAHLAPLNVGYTGIKKLSETTALELNFTLGFNLLQGLRYEYQYQEFEYDYFTSSYGYTTKTGDEQLTYMGILINPSVKFRYKKFGVGLDLALSPNMWASDISNIEYSNSLGSSSAPNTNLMIISATAGFKF